MSAQPIFDGSGAIWPPLGGTQHHEDRPVPTPPRRPLVAVPPASRSARSSAPGGSFRPRGGYRSESFLRCAHERAEELDFDAMNGAALIDCPDCEGSDWVEVPRRAGGDRHPDHRAA